MRIDQLRAMRERFRNVIEPLPTGQPSVDVLKNFHLRTHQSTKRVIMDAVAPVALRLIQPWIRIRTSLAIPIRYDLLSWGERWARGATQARLFRSLAPADLSAVLVQGCSFGDGAVQDWLRRGVKRVHGIDIIDLHDCWQKTLPPLRKAFSAEVVFRQGLIENMPYCDEMFDVVTSEAVYEHVYNLDAAARETARVLKPRGRCVHSIGPLYYCYAGDHCISEYGFAAGYDHLLMDDAAYRQRIEDQSFFDRTPDPRCQTWAVSNKFSFAHLPEYLGAFAPHFEIEFLLLTISPEGVRYRSTFPDRWADLLEAGLTPTDLLVKGINIICRKR
jgi:SAM-dependent methyltransferase